ncbi:PAS domain-containing sensor histidine kinase [Microbacterium lushaniae]|uniref:histidine kinase n=1 Tax=Microbacterium lushaniae TaxID=2614639 RepID=A0A5J6L327_9MICO|nr:PAS domain-containing sensor histidine kinase [Microbacterium lushaniae]QEW02934.1 PAS domain-containing protein [Microbacterium lushaniae]
MALLSGGARRARDEESTRDRTVLLNQFLLSGVTLVVTVVALLLGEVVRPSSHIIGVALIYLGAVAAVLVPWTRLPHWAAGILPIVDIVAIACLRESAPTAGLGLLWMFPAMWIASVYGFIGVIGATGAITAMLVLLTALDPAARLSASLFLLPILVAALGVLVAIYTRRSHVQRELLEKQSAYLAQSVDRARRQEAVVTEVLDAVDFGVTRITRSGDLVLTNEAHARLQGSSTWSGEEIPAFAADGTTRLDRDEAPLARARRGETFENELVWYGMPGEGRRALIVTARRLTDIDGTPAGAIVISRDVTNEEQALRAREDLVASVSHELRTPLTSIVGYLELALDAPDLSPQTRRDLEVAERNAGRLLELVADILVISASSRQGVRLLVHPERVDLSLILAAAIESIEPRAAERHITIDASDVHPASATVDPHRIRQVVDNLLSNAVKYNHDGGVVRAGLRSDGTHVWITVVDDGPGISVDEQPHLFERFFRSDSVRNSTTHGSGLGLAISRDIVHAHNGEIFVNTRPGAGAAFTVRLPITFQEETR